jgi:hypothetical protein
MQTRVACTPAQSHTGHACHKDDGIESSLYRHAAAPRTHKQTPIVTPARTQTCTRMHTCTQTRRSAQFTQLLHNGYAQLSDAVLRYLLCCREVRAPCLHYACIFCIGCRAVQLRWIFSVTPGSTGTWCGCSPPTARTSPREPTTSTHAAAGVPLGFVIPLRRPRARSRSDPFIFVG